MAQECSSHPYRKRVRDVIQSKIETTQRFSHPNTAHGYLAAPPLPDGASSHARPEGSSVPPVFAMAGRESDTWGTGRRAFCGWNASSGEDRHGRGNGQCVRRIA